MSNEEVQKMGLITEYTRMDDMGLITEYEKTPTAPKGNAYIKTHMMQELLLRMGNFSLTDLTEDILEKLYLTIEGRVASLNKIPHNSAREVAERECQFLARRYAMAKETFDVQQEALFGLTVQKGMPEDE